jgi:maltooligosyltrehalose trehalohydrolase
MTAEPLTVWAPRATSVDLLLPDEGRRLAMTAEPAGWWSAPALAPGTDYAFSLDGGPALPDPRSAWQPAGVHGPSRTFDPGRHEWRSDWAGRDARGAVHYELHVGTFTPEGTLDSAIDRLDHLVDLGIEMVEIMPVAAFDGHHGWGYDGVALYAVHDAYGGPAALQRFVDAAHRRGLAVCLDVVYNHLGPTGNYLGQFGPYFSDRHTTPWGSAVNLDGPDCGPVRAFVVENALRWFADFGIDALRLDAVHALVDESPVHVLAELADRTRELSTRLGRPLSLTAESDLNQPRVVQPQEEGGLGMTAQWADDVHHALHTLVTGERHGYYVDFGTLEVLDKAMTKVFVHGGEYSTFRHQVWGAPVPLEVGGHAFVVCDQNHDQVGNRALGDRPSRVLTDGQLAIEAAVILAGPFTPMLFMGEEWGARTPFQFFTDFQEDWLADAVREGRRKEFGEHGWDVLYGGPVEVPDPQDPATFEASKLDWAEPAEPSRARLLDFYRSLVALRASEPELASDDRTRTSLSYDGGEPSWFVLHRGAAAVVVNLAAQERHVPLPGADRREALLSWEPAALDAGGVTMPGHDVVVLGPQRPAAFGTVSGER